MRPSDDRHWILHLSISFFIGHKLPAVLLGCNGLADGSLGRALAELSHVCSGETFALAGKEVEIDVVRDRALTEDGLDNADARRLVGKRNVDQLVQTARSDECLVENGRSVRSADEEQVLFGTCTVHFSQQLVEDTIAGA